jgi:rsbT antagonist protein RsbS
MNIAGIHLTLIGLADMLLEPGRSLDISAQDDLLVDIIGRLQEAKAERLYYDLVEVPVIDPIYYHWLDALARACRSINVRMICIHMQPTAAFALAHHLKDMPIFETAHDVMGRKTTD